MPTGAGGLIQRITEIDPMAVRTRRIENYLRSELIIYTALLDWRMVSCTEKIGFILGKGGIIIWPVGLQSSCSNLLDREEFPKEIPDTRRSFLSFSKIGRSVVETLEEETVFTELKDLTSDRNFIARDANIDSYSSCCIRAEGARWYQTQSRPR